MSWALSILQICNAVVIEKRINFAKMNNKNSILLEDPGFDPVAALNCNLLLKITADSFSYAILNTTKEKIEVVYDCQDFQPTANNLSSTILSDPYLSLLFNRVKIGSYTTNTIAVPEAIYNPNVVEPYFKYFTDLEHYSDSVYTANYSGQDFKSLFLLPNAVESAIKTHWREAHSFEQTASLLAINQAAERQQFYIDFTAGSFHAMLLHEGKMIFQNVFQIENPEEFHYYLLLVLKQLKISTTDTKVLASGILNEGDEQHSILMKYFPRVDLCTPGESTLNNSILEDMPPHYYTSLLALNLCE
jgi:hypothetical protein